jgi:hypothetical protein
VIGIFESFDLYYRIIPTLLVLLAACIYELLMERTPIAPILLAMIWLLFSGMGMATHSWWYYHGGFMFLLIATFAASVVHHIIFGRFLYSHIVIFESAMVGSAIGLFCGMGYLLILFLIFSLIRISLKILKLSEAVVPETSIVAIATIVSVASNILL